MQKQVWPSLVIKNFESFHLGKWLKIILSLCSLSLIVTGSNDKIVRVWNPVVTTKPISLLSGHKAGLNDVKIRADKRLIFSYDKKAVLKVWDIDIGYCLQTLPLRFPRYSINYFILWLFNLSLKHNVLCNFSFDILGKEIEFGKPALYTVTSSEDLIIVSNHLFCFFI